jgi:hypothetical protein
MTSFTNSPQIVDEGEYGFIFKRMTKRLFIHIFFFKKSLNALARCRFIFK